MQTVQMKRPAVVPVRAPAFDGDGGMTTRQRGLPPASPRIEIARSADAPAFLALSRQAMTSDEAPAEVILGSLLDPARADLRFCSHLLMFASWSLLPIFPVVGAEGTGTGGAGVESTERPRLDRLIDLAVDLMLMLILLAGAGAPPPSAPPSVGRMGPVIWTKVPDASSRRKYACFLLL